MEEKIKTVTREVDSEEAFRAHMTKSALEAKKFLDDPDINGFLLVRVLKNGEGIATCQANPIGVMKIQEVVMKWSDTSIKTLIKDIILNQ